MPVTEHKTRLISHTFKGASCPINATYSKIHGPNPAAATINFKNFRTQLNEFNVISYLYGALNPFSQATLGQKMTIACDASSFIGYVVKKTINTDDSTGIETLSLELVDWRDRFHDFFIFGAFNVLENNGKCWHLLPKLWKNQMKIYISKELDQFDFDQLQEENTKSGNIEIVSKVRLLSSATILNILAEAYDFQWTASDAIKIQLQKTRPMNIDWQNGINCANALESILSKSNMIWTIKGSNTVVIHQKGVSVNKFFDMFLSGFQTMCSIDGRSASRGDEINEEGRNVLLIGERNKHQFTFPCRPDWNYEAWDFRLCFDQWTLPELLIEKNLFLWSKLKELPKEYHDDRPWSKNVEGFAEGELSTEKRTRNEMEIGEYVEKVCFKTYIVDFGCVVKDITKFAIEQIDLLSITVETLNKKTLKKYSEDAEDNLGHKLRYDNLLLLYPFIEDGMPFNPDLRHLYTGDDPILVYDYSSLYPISQALISDSNTQFIVLGTSMKMIKGRKFPFENVKFIVPTNKGISLETEEVIDPKSGIVKYNVRVIFSEPQTRLEDLKEWQDPDKFTPDRILIMLSLDKDIFTYERGSRLGVKVRTQKKSIKNLYRAFIDEEEVIVLAQNFQRDLKKGGAVPATRPVKAKYIASKIANQLLYHMAVTKTGEMSFKNKASHSPDGTIESVNVSFNDKSGLFEHIVFSSTYSSRISSSLPPSVYRVSRETITEAKHNREIMEDISDSITREAAKHGDSTESSHEILGSDPSTSADGIEVTSRGGLDNQNSLQAKIDLEEQEEGTDASEVVILEGVS